MHPNDIFVSLNPYSLEKHDIPILQMRKVGLRKVKQLPQGLMAMWRHDSKSRIMYVRKKEERVLS